MRRVGQPTMGETSSLFFSTQILRLIPKTRSRTTNTSLDRSVASQRNFGWRDVEGELAKHACDSIEIRKITRPGHKAAPKTLGEPKIFYFRDSTFWVAANWHSLLAHELFDLLHDLGRLIDNFFHDRF